MGKIIMDKSAKRGFNLIEIAIVLGVIGVVIGGIYVAAGAVRDNNRLQTTQGDIQQTVQNVRKAYTTRARFLGLTYAQTKTMNLMPADMQDTGSSFSNVYDGATAFYYPGYDQGFGIDFQKIPTAACVDLVSGSYGTGAAVKQAGLVDIGNGANDIFSYVSTLSNGIPVTAARQLCTTTQLDFVFSLRGE